MNHINSKQLICVMLLLTGGVLTSACFNEGQTDGTKPVVNDSAVIADTLDTIIATDTISDEDSLEDYARYEELTDKDFEKVAKELDVEVAAMKAVVVIEAGKAMKGFCAPGVPIVNFDRVMYNKYKSKAKNKAGDKNQKVPKGLTGHALKEWTELVDARKQNYEGANMGTFWGMFQIGGFNYKLCGCQSVDEFVKRMAYSELEQLQLFALFITNTGMLDSLRQKNWAAFARKYNGPSYAKRGYHTKMAKAYARYSAS